MRTVELDIRGARKDILKLSSQLHTSKLKDHIDIFYKLFEIEISLI